MDICSIYLHVPLLQFFVCFCSESDDNDVPDLVSSSDEEWQKEKKTPTTTITKTKVPFHVRKCVGLF